MSSQSVKSAVRKQEIRVAVWAWKFTRREREVMQRVLERHARELVEKWEAEDAEHKDSQ